MTKARQYLALLLAALLLPGCSMLTKSGRQQAAYEHYVQKMSASRVRQQRIFRSSKKPMMPMTEPSAPDNSSGPESVTTSESS